jgi:hypothetical protein
VSLFLEDIL